MSGLLGTRPACVCGGMRVGLTAVGRRTHARVSLQGEVTLTPLLISPHLGCRCLPHLTPGATAHLCPPRLTWATPTRVSGHPCGSDPSHSKFQRQSLPLTSLSPIHGPPSPPPFRRPLCRFARLLHCRSPVAACRTSMREASWKAPGGMDRARAEGAGVVARPLYQCGVSGDAGEERGT